MKKLIVVILLVLVCASAAQACRFPFMYYDCMEGAEDWLDGCLMGCDQGYNFCLSEEESTPQQCQAERSQCNFGCWNIFYTKECDCQGWCTDYPMCM